MYSFLNYELYGSLLEYKLNVTSTPIAEPVSSPFNEAIFIVEHDKMKSLFSKEK